MFNAARSVRTGTQRALIAASTRTSAARTTTVTVLAVAAVAVLNVAHPLLHAFEGGALDAMLAYGNTWASVQTGFRRP